MQVFDVRDHLVQDYSDYIRSFLQIRDSRIAAYLSGELDRGALWPDPLIQLNPSFQPGEWIDELVAQGVLDPRCEQIFRKGKDRDPSGLGERLRLHRHQAEAVRAAKTAGNYVLTTGTGSGKSLAYIVPIVDHVLRHGGGRGVQAVIVYPMNALANSQANELRKFLDLGFPRGQSLVRFARYTGQESDEERRAIIATPPDIILTNYVMLELVLTRPFERDLVRAGRGLRFLVLDELHTYRGRQGADVAMLVRRCREAFHTTDLQCVGTSATLVGPGTQLQQQTETARVASLLFGAPVRPENVIGETLARATTERNFESPDERRALSTRVGEKVAGPQVEYTAFVNDPLASWIESAFGVRADEGAQRLIRAKPLSITGENGAGAQLADLTGVSPDRCRRAIEQSLLAGYRVQNPATGFPAFAFRIHQFISSGEALYASLEPREQRHLTLEAQQFVPGDRDKVLLPTAFCRECGQEYYTVWRVTPSDGSPPRFEPRELFDRVKEEGTEPGFLSNTEDPPWPADPAEELGRLPEDWLEERRNGRVVKQSFRRWLPEHMRVAPNGVVARDGMPFRFLRAPFRFCVQCQVTYDARQRSDAAKLASLNLGGRSTATTILSLSAVQNLKKQRYLDQRAQKLLSFTDNRQDASLQAGHFNDFVEVGLLRSALYRAASDAGTAGLTHEHLTQKVFDVLNLPLEHYGSDPTVRFHARAETDRALRDVLGYRLYHDLRRGWRITAPNLEQCGLLEIEYLSLDDLCVDEPTWARRHRALATATSGQRGWAAKSLLDFLRRELAIKVEYLNRDEQERIRQRSSQRLTGTWALDEQELLEDAAIAFPRSRANGDFRGHVYLSARGGVGALLRRRETFPQIQEQLTTQDSQVILRDMLDALRTAGIVEAVQDPTGPDDVPGYQVVAGAMLWRAGDGSRAFHDPIRVPRPPGAGLRANQFFTRFYREIAAGMLGLEAKEHTAQVPSDRRQEREEAFRKGSLPVLYCSPTMELGVDIAELNAVNMRNVPPTPANYAQRSGRAGRSGQPALVFTYCARGNAHDQYFFRRPEQMVAGAVTPPRLDLTNRDLLEAHVHAVWLAETGQDLGKSLIHILDASGENPTLALLPSVRASLEDDRFKTRALERAGRVLSSLEPALATAPWHTPDWLESVLHQVSRRFEQACDRWRTLYRSALLQVRLQTRTSNDMSLTQRERDQARRLRREAESQLDLLADQTNVVEADFYSYRYLASEGFLPGYSFPRLPLSAFIPGRRGARGTDEFLSRPRFLAISEFGPRGIIYHEGSKYVIHKVNLPAEATEQMITVAAQCETCGYIHPQREGLLPDLCDLCGAALGAAYPNLFRLRNVSTKRRDRINSDEEERFRLGYELRTGIQFAVEGGRASRQTAEARVGPEVVARMMYGPAATIWRLNLGWSRRQNRNEFGFRLSLDDGHWENNPEVDDGDLDDPLGPRVERVIPFVVDHRNCLLVEPQQEVGAGAMASLQAVLRNAIQVQFQLEDSELAAEPLPSADVRRRVLLYESAEGGAGVLRRLIDEPDALAAVARQALVLAHFDPDTGEDRRRAPGSREDCEAACYSCLMSYANQRDHRLLDRATIVETLRTLARATVATSPTGEPREAHLARLLAACGSTLERQFLEFLETNHFRLPSQAQVLIEAAGTRPDFIYQEEQAVIYVDGPIHDYPERQDRDRANTVALEDQGYLVIRLNHRDSWEQVVARYPTVFGVNQ